MAISHGSFIISAKMNTDMGKKITIDKKKYVCIILLAVVIYSLFSLISGDRAVYVLCGMDNWTAEADNLFFPIYPLDPMVFPFQKLFHSIIYTHLPECLSFFKLIVFFSPAALAFMAGAAHSVLAGALSVLFICLLQHVDSQSLEQMIISSCLLAGIAAFFNFKEHPRWRFFLLSLSLGALAQSKGVFFPIVFLFVIYEAIIRHKDKKRIWPALLLSVPFLLSGIAWNIIAAQQNPGTSVFFTESGNRLIPNLMAGALGLIGTTEGSTVQVFDNPGIVHAFFIAAASVMAHPVLYAKSICGRFVFLAENAKFLYVLVLLWLASAAILICQRSRFILLPLCAAYCFGVYIIMPVEQRYFVPAWFLMSVCAGIAAAHFFKKIFSKINIGHKPLANKTQFILFGTFFVPHIAIWIVSVVLLITFPMRRNLFDIDKAYSLFPNNKYLELCPLRKTYPRIWDYKAMSGLLKKTSDNLEFKMYKARWLDYFSVYRSEQENTADSDIPVTVFGKKTYITWPDILLKSIQNYKAGNKKEGRRLAEAAALSCMLSSGYIRTHTGENTSYNEQETEYADKLAIASAHVCSNHLTMMFMAIPPWEHKAKELMMADGFGKYIEEKGLINLYAERKSLECGECCVPNGFLEVPSKCGFAVKHFVSAYECFDDYVCKGPNWCRGQINPTLQEKNFCMELNRKLTENDIALAGKYPVLQNTFAYRVLAQTALTASLADIQAGDKSNAAINLLRAVAICPGVKNDSNYTYAYNRITGMQ